MEVCTGNWYESNGMNHVWTQMCSNLIQSQEWVLFPFLFVRTNIYYRLDYKPLEGILTAALAYLIEGHWRTDILLLSVIDFNPSNVYALLHGAP